MARIRSVHPGLATDEAIVTASIPARYFFVLLLTECDDQGIFEWKPITLKMRLFPADNVDMAALLSELAAVNALCSYEIDGRKLGAVRNFRKYQRPKSPNALYPITPEIRNYVALDDAISETSLAQPPPLPLIGEKSPQMEDGGDKREDGKKESASGKPRGALTAQQLEEFETWWQHYPKRVARKEAERAFLKARKTATLEQLIAGAKRYAASITDPKYTANPATWLNQGRWLDEYPSAANGGDLPKPRGPTGPPPPPPDGWLEPGEGLH